ncbi:P22 phage major capsid protein family protein [uncultured Porphyromonas sp.]|jgi:hypothetical protein|uniref:P22 phage major capsid protein family protein n=1 Tax=uncultured Porphyromonas sp. TaxID=159274 RepID=UPI002602BDA4|nr:P22 phage major capsid protein family protein [uncultured Porphyromonas sp.]
MALQKEIWLDHLVGNLFPDNSFLSKSFNADQFVRAGKVVHIPNAGAKLSASVGPISRPKTATETTDTELTFEIKEIYTDPLYIQNADKYELSYDKRDAVLSACRSALSDKVATEILKSWIGTTTKTKLIGTTFSRQDVLKAQTKLNEQDIPQEGRYLLLDAKCYEELLSDLTEVQANAFLATANASTGVVGKLYGFEVMLRSSLINGVSAFAWHKDYVCRAQGDHEMFEQENDPHYYGDVLSFLVRAGGMYMKTSAIGTIPFEKKAGSV